MSQFQTVVTDAAQSLNKLGKGLNKPSRARKGKQSKAGIDRAQTNCSSVNEVGPAQVATPSNKPSHCVASGQSVAVVCPKQVITPMAMWPAWPAASIDRNGLVHATNAKVLQTLNPVMVQQAGQPLQLTTSANRRLWSMVTQSQTKEVWKVLDPVFWPFIGIVGWSAQSNDTLQVAAWEYAQTDWEIDDSWRQILAATAAVKSKRKRRVA